MASALTDLASVKTMLSISDNVEDGLLNLVMGVMIWASWPVSGLWVIGLFVGIDLLFHGWWLTMLALAVRGTRTAGPLT